MTSAGSVLFAQVFDAYGNPYATAGTDGTSFGFTGEQTDANGLVFLRARYYQSSQGRFLTRDVWQGDYTKPQSYNAWLYAFANPTNFTDPTGKFPEPCRSKWTKWGYAKCVLDFYHLEPAGSIFFNGDAVKNVKGSPGCWSGPVEYRAMGYLEGYSWFGTVVWGGEEIVYDFATMEGSGFTYIGGGINDSVMGAGYALYVGLVDGIRSDRRLQESYLGLGFVHTAGADISLPIDTVSVGLGGVGTTSLTDLKLKTVSAYISISASFGIPYIDVGAGIVNYTQSGNYKNYIQENAPATMLIDMTLGRETPYPEGVQDKAESQLLMMRAYAVQNLAPYYYYVYQEMQNERMRSNN